MKRFLFLALAAFLSLSSLVVRGQVPEISPSPEPQSSPAPSAKSDRYRPDYISPLSYSDALKMLTDKSISSSFDRSDNVEREVERRGIGFPWTPHVRMVLLNNGAAQGLITAVERHAQRRIDKIAKLDKEFRELFPEKDAWSMQRLLDVGNELLETIGPVELRVGTKEDFGELVEYLKKFLVRHEARLAELLRKPN